MPKIKIFNKSSTKMEEVQNESIQLVITSPPYGRIKQYSNDNDQIGNFSEDLQCEILKEVWKECYNKLHNGGFLVINLGEYVEKNNKRLYPFYMKTLQDCLDIGFNYFRTIIWHRKKTNQHLSIPFNYSIDYEFVIICFKGNLKNEKHKKISFSHSSVWNITPCDGENGLPIIPEELVKRILLIYSKEGDNILEPFTGSGTVLKVCADNNRNAIGYEINKEHIQTIIKKVGCNQKNLMGNNKCELFIV